MKSFKEYVLEGTSATITVLEKGVYKTSYLQYDGGATAAKILVKNYNKPEEAKLLVQKSGEIRDIKELEFYTDRTLLDITKSEKQAIKNANEMYIKYFFNGEKWYTGRGQISSFEELEVI